MKSQWWNVPRNEDTLNNEENMAGYFRYLLQQSKLSQVFQNLVAKSQNTKPQPMTQTWLDTCF